MNSQTPATNTTTPPRMAWILTLCGAIPFVSAAVGSFLLPPEQYPRLIQVASTYAAIILSFLGGIQWGLGITLHAAAPRSARSLFLISVSVSLASWFVLFIDSAGLRLAVAAGLFACVWAIDGMLRVQSLIPAWFFRLRSTVTAIVVCALALMAMKL